MQTNTNKFCYNVILFELVFVPVNFKLFTITHESKLQENLLLKVDISAMHCLIQKRVSDLYSAGKNLQRKCIILFWSKNWNYFRFQAKSINKNLKAPVHHIIDTSIINKKRHLYRSLRFLTYTITFLKLKNVRQN